jgi:UPF0271 protein
MSTLKIDLNSDVGESYGPYTMGADAELFPFISSANIACGFHAGDPVTMRKTLDLAAQHNVAVGAHPGFADRLHFGRLPLPHPAEEIIDMILYQIGALSMMAESSGLSVQHVKLHGALYHMVASDAQLSELFLDAIVRCGDPLIVVGPPGTLLQKEAEERGLDYAPEGFADRSYNDDGKLVSRNRPHSIVSDPEAAAAQAFRLAFEHQTITNSGKTIPLYVKTICIHGDTPGAPAIARAVRQKLEEANISIEPLLHLVE